MMPEVTERANAAGAERAAAFFRKRGLDRVIQAVGKSYWRNGRPVGRIVLDNVSDAEHQGLAALDGSPVGNGPLRLYLPTLDQRLRASAFGCSLQELLVAYLGGPLLTRRDERTAADEAAQQLQATWHDAFSTIAAQLPTEAAGRRWLEAGLHGIDWLTRLYVGGPIATLGQRQFQVRVVAEALSRLPLDPPRRLAVYANDCTGDPHAFDPGEENGRLLLVGLYDLQSDNREGDLAPPDRLTAAERRHLYARSGLLTETVSPTVVVYGLSSAIRLDGRAESSVPVDEPGPHVFPLRRLLTWQTALAATPRVWIVENPVVFEDLVDRLDADSERQTWQTLICTSGWPSDAGWRLLELLDSSDAAIEFCYSGDFDLAGLRIAAAVQKRFPARFRPWRLSAADYRRADRDSGVVASAEDLSQLVGFAPLFPDLVEAIQQAGRWAFQEALVDVLSDDLLRLR